MNDLKNLFTGKAVYILCEIHYDEKANEKNKCSSQEGECLHLQEYIINYIGKGHQDTEKVCKLTLQNALEVPGECKCRHRRRYQIREPERHNLRE